MTCVLHFSDTHFGTEQTPVVSALAGLIEELSPQALLLGGDVTQRARRSQFSAAADFLAQFRCPVVAVPGNHDIPLFNIFARVFSPYGGFKRIFGRELEPVWQSDQFLVVGVNTTRPRRHKDGEISSAQITRVVNTLHQARPGQLRIVMAHHPVRAIDRADKPNLMHGREDAVPAWVDAGADIILGGHIHLPYVLPVKGGVTDSRAWVIQAGTAVSSRTREGLPNSVNVIRYGAAQGEGDIQRWDFDASQARFVQVSHQALARPPIPVSPLQPSVA